MTLTLRACTTLLVGFLSVSGIGWAQSKSKLPDVKQTRTVAGMLGTMVKEPPVDSDDGITSLSAPAPTNPARTPKAELAADPAARESVAAPQDPGRKKAERAALKHQIKEKQRKIEFLMRMFVTDEQSFLRDPSGQSEDEELRAKRRFEQEELRREAAEVARLRTSLELMAPRGGEKAAPAKPAASD